MEQNNKISRHEAAIREIGHTKFSSRTATFHMTIFLIVLCLPVLAIVCTEARKRFSQTVTEAIELFPTRKEIRYIVRPQREAPNLFKRILNINSRVTKQAAQFDNNVVAESYLTGRLHPIMQHFLSKYLGQGNEKVFCGNDKWLFYKSDVEHVISPGFLEEKSLKKRSREIDEMMNVIQPAPLKSIQQFDTMLKARGIKLVLLPIPVKPMIYPEKLSRLAVGKDILPQNRSYEMFLQRLSKADITTVDVRQIFLSKKAKDIKVYFEQDSHWTPEGMKVTAIELSRTLKRQHPEISSKKSYTTKYRKISNFGDTQKMLKLPETQTLYSIEKTRIEEVFDAEGKHWQPDSEAEILLLGDSLCNIFSMEALKWGEHAGLAEQLSYQLQSPIDTILQNDAAAHATVERLNKELRQGKDRLANKKFVVWEFTVRELSLGNWKTDFDWSIPSEDAIFRGFMPRGISKVVVKVLKKSLIPNLKASDYPNCLYTYKAEVYKHLHGVKTPEVLMINSWAFKNMEYADTSRIQEDDFLEIEIEQMDSVSQNLKRIMVSDNINDINTMLYFERAQATSPSVNKTYKAPAFSASVRKGPDKAKLEEKQAIVFSKNAKQDKAENISKDIAMIDDLSKHYGGTISWIKALAEFQLKLTEIRKLHVKKYPNKPTFVGKHNFLFEVGRSKFLINKAWQDSVIAGDKNSDDLLYPQAFDSIIQTHDWLKERSIDLIVVPIPSRAEVYSDLITDVNTIAHVAPHRLLFNRRLLQSGVEVVDLMPYFLEARQKKETLDDSRTLYCRDDPHWNTEGIKIAAKIVASRLKRYEFKQQKMHYNIISAEQNSNNHLLANMPDKLKHEDYRQIKKVDRVCSGENRAFKINPDSPVLVCGDSYLKIFNTGSLPAHLSKELGYAVDTINQSGAGPIIPKLLLSKDPEYMEKKSVVIWFFVARYLPVKKWILMNDLTLPVSDKSGRTLGSKEQVNSTSKLTR